jgi:hypothetical protein
MRGTAAGESIQSQAGTEEFREGYDRVFGERKPQRGRWVMTPKGLVPADEYVPEHLAVNAPILTDRLHEGQKAPDGTPIDTRRKRKAWMEAAKVVDYADGESLRQKRNAEQAAKARGEYKPDKELRAIIGRELYKQKVIY